MKFLCIVHISIQLLLLFIFPTARWDLRIIYFNTTLVIVYRCRILFKRRPFIISIQLLLLFICLRQKHLLSLLSFQYNSCYCLSSLNTFIPVVIGSFQYNSCYCLSIKTSQKNSDYSISIQLLLLFIDPGRIPGGEVGKISIQLLLLFIQRF